MPRAFCPECGSEVPVDPDGVCHVGHVVGVTAASVGPADELEVEFADASDPDDEPEPWVANVDHTQLGGYTPPPDATAAAPTPPPPMPAPAPEAPADAVTPPPPSAPASPPPAASVPPDEPAWTPSSAGHGADEDEPEPGIFDLGGGGPDDLAAAAAAAAEEASRGPAEPESSLWGAEDAAPGATSDAPGWTPPTADAVAPPPQPPPAPVEPPAAAAETAGHDEMADFDLADLEAAVVEMETEPERPATASDAGSGFDDLDALMRDDDAAEAETVTAEIDLPPPSTPPPPARDDEELAAPPEEPGVVGSFPRPSDAPDASRPAEPVDLSNFTAKGDKVKGGGTDEPSGKKSFFRLRR